MIDREKIDAEQLWQLLNLYANGGHLEEVKNLGTPSKGEGVGELSEVTIWPVGSDGSHVSGWWPTSLYLDALMELELIQPEQWQQTERPKGAIRRYSLTPAGLRMASMKEPDVLGELARAGIHEHQHGDITVLLSASRESVAR